MRTILTSLAILMSALGLLLILHVRDAQAKIDSSENNVRAGDEEFHKFRKRQYKIAKKGSTYAKVPMLEIEDTTFWKKKAYEELEAQLNLVPKLKMAKNVIMFLGDGMSFSTVAASRILKGQKSSRWEHEEMTFDKFPYTGFLKTYTTDSQVADSAASATAYLCGTKGNLGTIGVDVNVAKENCTAQQDARFHTPSILQWFQDSGRSTGFVTTMRVTHATPAGSYAHVADREWEDDREMVKDGIDDNACDDIAEQLVLRNPGRNMRVIMGGGRRGLFPRNREDEEEKKKKGVRKDGKNLVEQWQLDKARRGANYRYIWNKEQLYNTNFSNTDYLMGLFAWSHMDYILDRDDRMDPSLVEMTAAALNILQRDRNGYFLLVEGGLIDHGHHGNKAKKALTETLEFDKAIHLALRRTNPEDTLLIVTSDHSHSLSINGYSSRHSDILGVADYSGVDYIPYTTLLYGNGPGFRKLDNHERTDPSQEDIHDSNYRQAAAIPESSSTHSGEDVGVWAYGPHAHLFMGVHEQSYIAHAIAYAACVGDGPIFCHKFSNNLQRPRKNRSKWSSTWPRTRGRRG